MANLLKKKFIGNDQIDGSKILIENNEFLRVKKADGSIKSLFKVDGDDKFIMSEAPIITTPGTEANSLQTKSQLETAVSAEATLRASADAVLQGEVDAVETGLAQELLDRASADTALDGKITTEKNRAEGVEAELAQDILDEKARAEAAEALLIPLTQKGSANGVAPLNAQGLIESQFLPSYVDDVLEFANLAGFPATGETSKMYVALDSGKIYRWSGSTYIEISSNEVNSVFGRVGHVVAQAGDYTTDQVTEGSKLYFTEARAQQANDARFDLVEADVASHESRLDAHDVTIADHESRLDAIEAEIPAWFDKKIALSSTDISNGYVDLDHVAVPKSIVARVDRLAIHEGASEDFTTSEVGGKTRITFVNSMVSPGAEALSVGDNVYFKYQF